MSILDDFNQRSGKIESPKDLYAAIKEYGPLPRYHERECFAGEVCLPYQTGDGVIRETEPAEQDARDLYHHVRAIAISLRESNPNLKPLPKSETDPFVGIQTIQEWCLDTDADGGDAKSADNGSNKTTDDTC